MSERQPVPSATSLGQPSSSPPPVASPTATISITNAFIPRDATRVSDLEKHAGVNGSGVTVAILDTGVDPGAAGLQRTPSGERKLLDIVDCTAAGDVPTVHLHTLPADCTTITGLSGRTLSLPHTLIALNPTRVFRLGLKHAYDLFPAPLVGRLRAERRRLWDKNHYKLLNQARLNLSALRAAAPAVVQRKGAADPTIDEADAIVAGLLAAEKAYRDPGPVYDCLVFHDGSHWRAVVDTSECGDLARCDVLENFALHGSYSTFPAGIMLNFGVNIYHDGALLSIVVDCDSHGTHVAGIVAAHFPDRPDLDGVAPGAKLVSLKIGDTRLSSMETHQGLQRALAYCLRASAPSPSPSASKLSSNTTALPQLPHPRIDVVNMSFGEHCRDPNHGRFVKLVERLVHQHNVVFVSSAGNDGPGLSSVTAPGGTTDAIIGVGAYVTPRMMTQAYSLLQSEYGPNSTDSHQTSTTNESNPTEVSNDNDANSMSNSISVQTERKPPNHSTDLNTAVTAIPYTWCARGPVFNGSLGVSVCAPGGAIAPVPQWLLKKKQLMNGTSMSSPSAAGAVAAVLSYVKQRQFPYTSALIRRAVENTARPVRLPDNGDGEVSDVVFATGAGSVDAYSACQYIERYMQRRVVPTVAPDLNSHSGGPAEGKADTNHSRQVPAILIENTKSRSGVPKVAARDEENGDTYTSKLEDFGDSSSHIEDWDVSVSLSQRNSSPGPSLLPCGILRTTRGIYLRGFAETRSVFRANVTVGAKNYDEDNVDTKQALVQMEVHMEVRCDADWVECPASFSLYGDMRAFPVVVDPTLLAPGRVHFAKIVASVVDATQNACPSGPLFTIPVTVAKPEALVGGMMISPLRNIRLSAGHVIRRFYEAPAGATYALLKITTGSSFLTLSTGSGNEESDSDTSLSDDLTKSSRTAGAHDTVFRNVNHYSTTENQPSLGLKDKASQSELLTSVEPTSRSGNMRNYEVHIMQVIPQSHGAELETRQLFSLSPGMIRESMIRVRGGCTMELCLAQMWSSPGNSLIDKVEVMFAGLQPSPSVLNASIGSLCFPRVEVSMRLPPNAGMKQSALPISGYQPKASLSRVQRTTAPRSANIYALGERDDYPLSTMFQLQLDYVFEVFETSCNVSLRFPGLNSAVYEAEIEGGPYVMVHNEHKQFIFSSDTGPQTKQLPEGEYYASAYLRHERMETLEQLRDLLMTVSYDLPSEVSLEPYSTAQGACLGLDERKVSRTSVRMESGERRVVYFATPKRSALPKWVNEGDVCVGIMTIDAMLSSGGSSIRPNQLPQYSVQMTIGSAKPASLRLGANRAPRAKPAETISFKPVERKNSVGLSNGAALASVPLALHTRAAPNVTKNEEDNAADNVSKGSVKTEDEDEPDTSSKTKGDKIPGKESTGESWFLDGLRKLRLTRLRSLLQSGKFEAFDKLLGEIEREIGHCKEYLDFAQIALEAYDVRVCRTLGYQYQMHMQVTANAMPNSENNSANPAPEAVAQLDKLDEARQHARNGISACNVMLTLLPDAEAIAAHFGRNITDEDAAEATTRKEFEEKRGRVVEALFRAARMLSLVLLAKADARAHGVGADSVGSSDSGDRSESESGNDESNEESKEQANENGDATRIDDRDATHKVVSKYDKNPKTVVQKEEKMKGEKKREVKAEAISTNLEEQETTKVEYAGKKAADEVKGDSSPERGTKNMVGDGEDEKGKKYNKDVKEREETNIVTHHQALASTIDSADDSRPSPDDANWFDTVVRALRAWTTLDGKGTIADSPNTSSGSTNNSNRNNSTSNTSNNKTNNSNGMNSGGDGGSGSGGGGTDEGDAPVNDEQLALLGARRYVLRDRPAAALRVLDTFYGNGSASPRRAESAAASTLRVRILHRLGWAHVACAVDDERRLRFPADMQSY